MSTDLGLSDLGREQAVRLRDRLAATGEIDADVLIASTLPRAKETAAIIAPALGLNVVFDDDLQEMRCGEGEGLTYTEFVHRFGEHKGRSASEAADPGGECWSDFVARVAGAVERISVQCAGRSVVVVCHGGVIEAVMAYLVSGPFGDLPRVRLETDNTSITEWTRHDEEREATWRLWRYNDAVHVRDIGADVPFDWTAVRRRQ